MGGGFSRSDKGTTTLFEKNIEMKSRIQTQIDYSQIREKNTRSRVKLI